MSRVELLLIDGPGAGKRVTANLDWMSSYVFTSWPDRTMPNLSFFNALDTVTFAGPTHTVYRIGGAYNMDRQLIRVGWCSGEPEPDPEELEYWIRYEPPIKIVAGADSWSPGCDLAMWADAPGAQVRGVCRCGWETETVPRRRARELVALIDAHSKIGRAMAIGSGLGVSGARSVGQAVRYETSLNRAEAIGMSREQAQRIFEGEMFFSYGFEEAMDHVEHRIRLAAMYGYLPLVVHDVLSWSEIRAHGLESNVVLNAPRWMPDPLGRQFAVMGRGRQRGVVEAAVEVVAQLGGEEQGWPLERAMAAVMPRMEG